MKIGEEIAADSPQGRARDAVRELPTVPADEGFRSRLRQDFIAGTLAPRLRVVRTPWAGAALWVPLAAAAALVLVALGIQRPLDWQVVRLEGVGKLTIDGRAVGVTQSAEIDRLLRHGGHLVLPDDAGLDLVAPGQLAVSLHGGTDIVVPSGAGGLGPRHMRAQVLMGNAYFETGPRFHGSSLDVETPEATAHVVGTSFAVLRQPHGTCVCVMEGRVRVTHRLQPRDVVDVPAGLRRMCYDDSESETGPILQSSVHALHALRGESSRLLGR